MNLAAGVTAGLLLGTGLCLILHLLAHRRPSLVDRVAPYVRERPRTSRLLTERAAHTPFPTVERLLVPVARDAAGVLERLGSTSASVRRRLQLLGSPMSVEQFRIEQLMWAVLGLAIGLVLTVVLGSVRSLALVPAIALVLLFGAAGALARDWRLGEQARSRQSRMATELPDVAELLSLAVAAGEGPIGALERVSRTARGELTADVRAALADARSGIPLSEALERMAARTDETSVARFAEGVSTALERGTPLADVLRAQAQDARDAGRRALLESGGRKEVTMMIPIVFLVLPTTIVFALFPGLAVLELGL